MRLEIGDTDSTDALFTDEEINYKLTANADSIVPTVIELCDILAVRFSREFDFETDDQKFARSQKAKAYADRAAELRAQGGSGFTTTSQTKIDGYSQDITGRDASPSPATGRVKRGYYDPDLPY